MDTLRGHFEAMGVDRDYDADDDEAICDAPPAAIGNDERRMQVRAYNHWAGLLDDRNFPPIDGFDPAAMHDFGPFSVLLDFTNGTQDPGVTYLGDRLAAECDVFSHNLQTLADVPSRSLLSRITDHYMQILANQAPIGFEAEFVNQRGATILYRGILLPFSSDDETIDFIFGVINWKELADQHTSDELLLQVDQALESPPAATHPVEEAVPAWAANDTRGDRFALGKGAAWDDDEDEDEDGESTFDYAKKFNLNYDDEEYDEDEGEAEDEAGLPRPSFGSLTSIGASLRKSEPRATALPELPADLPYADDGFAQVAREPAAYDGGYVPAAYEPAAYQPDSLGADAFAADDPEAGDLGSADYAEAAFAAGDLAPEGVDLPEGDSFAEAASDPVAPAVDPADMELGDWLAAARESADMARSSEDRTRATLYDAIGRAYDFSLAAAENPADFEELVVDAGLTVQERAPMTPVVKLVFGADYDKTRLTEYATALGHAHRVGLPRGGFGAFLRNFDGGLKAVVAAERRLRKIESGKQPAIDPREALVAQLRALEAIDLADLPADGGEFALVMIRRSETGTIEIVGEVPDDASLLERAARKLVG